MKDRSNMKTLVLAIAAVVLVSGTALACRGTTEFPDIGARLQSLTLSAARMQDLKAELTRGQSMHEEGHRIGDGSKMSKSLRILDDIKRQIGE